MYWIWSNHYMYGEYESLQGVRISKQAKSLWLIRVIKHSKDTSVCSSRLWFELSGRRQWVEFEHVCICVWITCVLAARMWRLLRSYKATTIRQAKRLNVTWDMSTFVMCFVPSWLFVIRGSMWVSCEQSWPTTCLFGMLDEYHIYL